MSFNVRHRRAARWLCAGLLALPACVSIKNGSSPDSTPPAERAVPLVSASLGVVQAEARVKDGHSPRPEKVGDAARQSLPTMPTLEAPTSPLPINLPTALSLVDARPIDVLAAAERIQVAAAQLELARAAWLPTLTLGFDYNRHDGRIQDIEGRVISTSRSGMMFGAGTGIGPAAILNVNDAIFAPLIARQTVRARQADHQTAQNDSLVAVTNAYFNVQQARGELAGAAEAARKTEDLVRRTRKLAEGLVPELEATRAEAELARRQQVEELARERWRVASAELVRVLRLDPATQVDPVEPPNLRVDLIDPAKSVDELIPIALASRPELASRQAQVQATLALLRREKLRPLVPSVLLRGWSTPVTGTLAAGVFAGGTNGTVGNAGLRGDIDVQLLWQFDNLGFGNRAMTHQREAENRLAVVELFRVQDQVAADVAQAYARSNEASRRVAIAERGVRLSAESAEKNLAALGQVRRVGEINQLVVRPQEAVASVQALAQAYSDYFTAVADYNRAQFQLYRALGRPAQCVATEVVEAASSPVPPTPAAEPILPSPLPEPEAPAAAAPARSGETLWHASVRSK